MNPIGDNYEVLMRFRVSLFVSYEKLNGVLEGIIRVGSTYSSGSAGL